LDSEKRKSYNPFRGESPDWDVFDAEGHFLGVVSMPDHFTPWLFVGDAIYGVQRDELDAESVVRLRVVRPPQ
jgi:hypothetical protein